MAGLRPIELQLKLSAIKTAIRLDTNKDWEKNTQLKDTITSYYHTDTLSTIIDKTKSYKTNDLIPKTKLKNKYTVESFEKEDIKQIIKTIPKEHIQIYTDGSLIKAAINKTGAPVYV